MFPRDRNNSSIYGSISMSSLTLWPKCPDQKRLSKLVFISLKHVLQSTKHTTEKAPKNPIKGQWAYNYNAILFNIKLVELSIKPNHPN